MRRETTASERATSAGTASYARRFAESAAPGHFREALGLHLSSLGLGTYLGRADEAGDQAYRDVIGAAVAGGINVLDTAVNYRGERSERALGAALADLAAAGFPREGVVVATKGGYVPARDPEAYFEEHIVRRGRARAEDLVAGCHCLAPGYLRHQLDGSLENLGLGSVDIYYLHNPEQQLEEVEPATFGERVRAAFEMLEEEVGRGRVGHYGTATWKGYRPLFTILHTCAECPLFLTPIFRAFFPILAYDNVHYHHLTPCRRAAARAVINDSGARGASGGG